MRSPDLGQEVVAGGVAEAVLTVLKSSMSMNKTAGVDPHASPLRLRARGGS